MNKLDGLLTEWAESEIRDMHKSGIYGINTVEKILSDPGISTKIQGHRILWWPRTRRIAKMSRLSHRLTPIERICLIIRFGWVLNDDNTRFKKEHLAQCSSIDVGKFDRIVRTAKRKIRGLL